MRAVACFLLLFAGVSRADEVADRSAIQRVVETLNERQTATGTDALSRLFTADASTELQRLLDINRLLWDVARRPMSEVTPPRFALGSTRFVNSDVAVVDAFIKQYGSLLLDQRTPVMFLMKREGTEWRIAVFRVMDSCTPAQSLARIR